MAFPPTQQRVAASVITVLHGFPPASSCTLSPGERWRNSGNPLAAGRYSSLKYQCQGTRHDLRSCPCAALAKHSAYVNFNRVLSAL